MASTLNLKRPDVYIQEISKFPPSVAQVATAIPAFIGHTEFARKDGEDLTLKPTKITSLLEYRKFFGGPQKEQHVVVAIDDTTDAEGTVVDRAINAKFLDDSNKPRSRHNMFYSLQIYFANGGGPCYIVSIGPYMDPVGAEIPLGDATEGFQKALTLLRKEDEHTILCAPEGQGMSEANYALLVTAMLNLCVDMQDRFVVADVHNDGTSLETAGDVDNAINPFRDRLPINKDILKYGSLYFPNIKSVFNYETEPETVIIQHNVNGQLGAGALEGMVKENLPDKALEASVAAALDALTLNLPPSPAIAGIYARVDNARGVWKAPANVSVFAINGLTFKVTDLIHENLNVDVNAGKSVNAIRSFTGRGTLVWGARTLAGNDNEWRYISVRRFFNMVEESVKKATYQFVFEPNDANTWAKIRAMIENFLLLQWRAGALAGAVPEDAFFVHVGLGKTMTAQDILEGRLIVEIGMAAVRPAEFIILKFSHKMQVS
ncbi:MAG: phage tail sheath family protein [Bacteroidetes bacterium]|nr:phage tail sheath family protein [Bacteroidota bacterium]